MDAEATVRTYYDALRAGEPLYPFFAADAEPVKFGVTERLAGYDAVRDGLREQTRTTTDWDVRSRGLRVTERDCHAWFADDVFLAWTDADADVRYSFDTRWSGAMERQESAQTDGDDRQRDDSREWQFVGMHVSRAVRDLEARSNGTTDGESPDRETDPRRRPVEEGDG